MGLKRLTPDKANEILIPKMTTAPKTIPQLIFFGLKVLLLLFLLLVLASLFVQIVTEPGIDRRASAKNDAVQIATAITGYETEYGQLPSKDSLVQEVGGPMLQALMASNDALNPRRIVFIEVGPAKKNKGGLLNGIYVDPWGSPYKVKFDTDYDNRLQDVGSSQSRTAELKKKVAVWNDPDTHADKPNEKAKARRAVTSWD